MGTKKWGLFWCGLPKIGVIQCAKMQFQAKICKFYIKIPTKLLNLSKCARSAQKICNLYVKFDTKVEKRGPWVWTECKRGSLGVGSALKKGSIDRYLISTDIC